MIGGLLKSASSAALFAAVGLLMVGGVPAAKAADLGGDCCADLEERVAELEATTARKGNRRVSLTISGQVTTALMHWNDGNNGNIAGGASSSDTYVVDNVMAGGTFFSFAGSAKINPNVSAGFNITMALCSGSRSHHVNQADDDAMTPSATQANPSGACFNGSTDATTVMTLANWYLDHKSLGRVTVGRINTATAGITTIDLGGAGVIANASIGYTQRGMFLALNDNLQTGTWTSALGGNDVNGASLSRANAISYTSPTMGGFSVAAAWGEDNIWDVALRYAGEFAGFRLAAGIGYINNSNGLNEVVKDHAPTGDEPNILKGSASVLHVASGLYLTGAVVDKDWNNGSPNTTLYYVQGGISKNWTGLGNTVLYGEWSRVNDGIICGAGACGAFGGNANDVITSSQANMWGLGIVQHIDAAAMEVFLSYKRFSADVFSPVGNNLNGTVDYNDMDVVMGGARIRF